MGNLSSGITAAQVSLSNLPERTVWVDDTVLDIIGSNSIGDMVGVSANQKPTAVRFARAQASKDSTGAYWLDFNIHVTTAGSTAAIRFWFAGILSNFGSSVNHSVSGWDVGGNSSLYVVKENNQNRFVAEASSNSSSWVIGGKIPLDSKPSWFDANREAGFSVAAQIDEATATNLGLVKANKWQRKYLASDKFTGTTLTDLGFSGLAVGKYYRVSVTAYILNTGNSATELGYIQIMHDGSSEARIISRQDSGAADVKGFGATVSTIIKATASTVTFVFTQNGISELIGNGTADETHSMIEELNNYEDETTDF